MELIQEQPTTTITNSTAMIRLPILLGLLLVLAAGLGGCEEPAGSEGPRGAEGPQGQDGPIGPAGEDGSVIHADEGPPGDAVGKQGDFYLDQDTGDLYGPKTTDDWGTPISLQGPPGADGQDGADGEDGEDGSQIYAGTGPPDASLGVEGDYYLDKADYELYGPKTGSGWETPISLKGAANVLYLSWLDIDWNETDEDTFKRMAIPESRITDEFLDTGAVAMYLKEESSDEEGSFRQAFALPLAVGNTTLYFSAITSTGAPSANVPSGFTGLFVTNESLNGNAVLTLEDFQIRYVLIPGGEPLKAKAKTGDLPIDLNDYQQVKRYFGIRNE